MAGTEGSCPIAQKQLVLTLCDFLTEVSTCQKLQKQFGPLVESRVKSVLREYLLHGILKQGFPPAEAELRATLASWAIYGAALEWSRSKLTHAGRNGGDGAPADPACAVLLKRRVILTAKCRVIGRDEDNHSSRKKSDEAHRAVASI